MKKSLASAAAGLLFAALAPAAFSLPVVPAGAVPLSTAPRVDWCLMCHATAVYPNGYFARKPAQLLVGPYDGFNNPAPVIQGIVWSSWGHTRATGSGLADFNGSSGYCRAPQPAGNDPGCSYPVNITLSIPVREGRIGTLFSTLTISGPTFSGDGNQPAGSRFSYSMLPGD